MPKNGEERTDKIMKDQIENTTNMVESEETSLIVPADMHELKASLFDNSGEKTIKKITSLDLNDEKNVDMLLNSMQEVDFKLNECINKEIEVVGCMATEREEDSVNEESGEVITRKKHVLMLFDKNGKSYVTGSNACYMSFVTIVSLKGMPTKDKPLVLIPIKTDAKEKGHSYLRLKLKSN